MPNHCTTTMRVTGPAEEVVRFRETHMRAPMRDVSEPDGKLSPVCFDFNTLVPMPAILHGIVSGSQTDDAVEAITGKTMAELANARNPNDSHVQMVLDIQSRFRNIRTEEETRVRQDYLANLPVAVLEKGRQAIQALEETGYPTWYEWSLANWGTKWNSYSYRPVSEIAGEFVCRYETAWAPPLPVWEAMVQKWPMLTFEVDSYDEGGGFALHGIAERGAWTFEDVQPDAVSYRRAYGEDPPTYDDEEAEEAEPEPQRKIDLDS